MNKLFYAEQLENILYPNPTADAKMDENIALAAISQARDEVIRMQVLQSKLETNMIPYSWLSEFSGDDAVDIQKDKYGKFYCKLPADIIAMTQDQGLRQVWLQGNDEDFIIPVPAAFKGMFKNQPARALEGYLGYYYTKGRITFLQDMDLDCKVEIRMLAQSYDLDEYAEFPCDDSMINTILERALRIYQLQKGIPQDLNNNNISE